MFSSKQGKKCHWIYIRKVLCDNLKLVSYWEFPLPQTDVTFSGYVCVGVWMYLCVCGVCVCVWMCVWVYVCVFGCGCVYVCVCVCVGVCVLMCVWVYVYVYVCVCVGVGVYVCARILWIIERNELHSVTNYLNLYSHTRNWWHCVCLSVCSSFLKFLNPWICFRCPSVLVTQFLAVTLLLRYFCITYLTLSRKFLLIGFETRNGFLP
jgi:hypothetical protein